MEPLPSVSPGDPHVSAHNIERQAINEIIEWKETSFLEGDGFPYENAPLSIAPVGTEYIDRLKTCGARKWVRIGEDFGDWKVIEGDTGWCQLPAKSLKISTSTTTLYVRRINNQVALSGLAGELTGTALVDGEALFDFPEGFEPHAADQAVQGLWCIGNETTMRRCAITRPASGEPFALIVYGTTAINTGFIRLVIPNSFIEQHWPFVLPNPI